MFNISGVTIQDCPHVTDSDICIKVHELQAHAGITRTKTVVDMVESLAKMHDDALSGQVHLRNLPRFCSNARRLSFRIKHAFQQLMIGLSGCASISVKTLEQVTDLVIQIETWCAQMVNNIDVYLEQCGLSHFD
jgi:hypothetical protein